MAKPLRIGSMIDVDEPLPDVVAQLRRYAEAGLDHAFASQIFGPDALTLLAVAGSQVPGIGLGTGVVPVYPRHPMMLAQQALTVQWATGNRLLLGIGLSHQVVVESMWGMSYDKPARYMREYLASLMPLLRGETVQSTGERVTTNAFVPLDIPGAAPPPVLVAALGPAMLKLAGTVADGTITWMTGTRTIAEHIAPTITAAAEAAGRPAPRVVVSLPVAVTGRRRRQGADRRGVRDLPEPALLPGHAGQGGRGDAADIASSATRRRWPLRSGGWPTPGRPTSWPPSWATLPSASAALRC